MRSSPLPPHELTAIARLALRLLGRPLTINVSSELSLKISWRTELPELCQQRPRRDTRLDATNVTCIQQHNNLLATVSLDNTHYESMNYEAQLFTRDQHSRPVTRRHGHTAATQRESLPLRETMQKVQAHDDETLGSGSSITGAHALDNETDTFGREIMQHERDARRIRNATRRDPRPVLKTRSRPRISELVARREREETLASEQQHVRTGSTGSNESNPPLNVPRDWGSRARSHRGWMRKIREPSEANVNASSRGLLTPEEEEMDARPRTSYANDNVWSQGDEHAISMENTPPSMRRKRPNSQPPTLRDANSTLRHIIDSEDQGFSQLSLLASTPAAITSTKRSNDAPRQSMDRVEHYNVANYRQDLLSERSPNRNTSHSRDVETNIYSNETRTIAQPDNSQRPTTASLAEARAARMARRRGLLGNKENVPVNDTYTSSHKANETVTISDRSARAVTFKQQQRPSQTRTGSLHLLQRLATSLSPSPGASSSEAARPNVDEAAPREQDRVARQHRTDDVSATSNRSTTNRSWRNRSSARQDVERLQPNHTAPGQQARIEELDSNETPMPKDRLLDDKTPVITGAWVDTPALSKDARPSLASHHSAPTGLFAKSSGGAVPEKARTVEPIRASHSDRPKSALEDIVRDARKDPNGPYGDATIQSLEDIIHPNADATDTTLSSDAGAATKENAVENPSKGRPLTQAEQDRREEDLAIEAMNKHLRAARTSIKDADRGLQRVENKWESTSHAEVPQPRIVASAPKQVVKADRDWKTACEHCGGSYHSVWSGLWTELRSNFYYYDDSAWMGVRLTWLGILTLLWILWNALENLLCMYYCHPLYAEYMVGFGVNPDAPRYPFVIPTLLFRPLRPIWKPVLQGLEASFTAGLHAVFGGPPERDLNAEYRRWQAAYPQHRVDSAWTSGWGGKVAATTATAAARVTASLADAVDDMGYGFMQDDEFL